MLIINLRACDVDFPTNIFRGCVPLLVVLGTLLFCFSFSMNEKRNWLVEVVVPLTLDLVLNGFRLRTVYEYEWISIPNVIGS